MQLLFVWWHGAVAVELRGGDCKDLGLCLAWGLNKKNGLCVGGRRCRGCLYFSHFHQDVPVFDLSKDDTVTPVSRREWRRTLGLISRRPPPRRWPKVDPLVDQAKAPFVVKGFLLMAAALCSS